MNTWMLCKVRYNKQLDNGTFKKVTEQYLFSAVSFTDAEARIFEEVATQIKGDFTVVSIARQELHDIYFFENQDAWYLCKTAYSEMDSDSEKTSTIKHSFLVNADSIKEATERLKDTLSTTGVDYEITSVSKTPILEVYEQLPQMSN